MDLKKSLENCVERNSSKNSELSIGDDLIIQNSNSFSFLQNFSLSQSEHLQHIEDDIFASKFVENQMSSSKYFADVDGSKEKFSNLRKTNAGHPRTNDSLFISLKNEAPFTSENGALFSDDVNIMASQNDSFDSLKAKQQHNNINATNEIDFVETEGSFGFMVDCDDFLLKSQNHNASATIDIRGQQSNATAFAEIDKNTISDDFTYFFGKSTDIDNSDMPINTGNTNNLIWLAPDRNRIHDNSNIMPHLNNGLCETTLFTDSDTNFNNCQQVLLPKVDLFNSH